MDILVFMNNIRTQTVDKVSWWWDLVVGPGGGWGGRGGVPVRFLKVKILDLHMTGSMIGAPI